MKKTILYIHGVGGSEYSPKAIMLRDRFTDYNVEVPKQSNTVFQTTNNLVRRISESTDEKFILVGSSRGGLIALYLGYLFDIPVIAINPALTQSELNYNENDDQVLKLMAENVKIDNNSIENSRLTHLFLGSQDELIDPKEAAELNSATLSIRETNHKYDDFEMILDSIEDIIRSYDNVATESDVFEKIFD